MSYTDTIGSHVLAHRKYLLLRRTSPQKNLSAAQRCNSDVLEEIFSHLERVTLTRVARVCRGWQPPASVKLYYDVKIEAWKASASILASTMTAQPDLRKLVRRVTLDHTRPKQWVQLPFEWLALLPERSLSCITLRTDIFSFPEAHCLLDFPAVLTVPHLFAHGVRSGVSLTKIMSMPHLQTLAIKIPDGIDPASTGVLKPTIRKLAISSYRYETIIEHILQSFDLPLERFTLSTAELEEADLASLKNGLKRHTPSLKYLSFMGKPFFPSSPFMDDYILAFPSLEMLLCPYLSYTPLLISRLPHTLSTLALRTGIGEPFDSDNYAAALQLRSGHLHALSELVLDTNGGKPEYPSLAAVCTSEGISFRIVERNRFNPFLSSDREFQ